MSDQQLTDWLDVALAEEDADEGEEAEDDRGDLADDEADGAEEDAGGSEVDDDEGDYSIPSTPVELVEWASQVPVEEWRAAGWDGPRAFLRSIADDDDEWASVAAQTGLPDSARPGPGGSTFGDFALAALGFGGRVIHEEPKRLWPARPRRSR
jgi:hypothetical protein